MGELAKMQHGSSLLSKISSAHNKIIATSEIPKDAMELIELKQIMLRVAIFCGIKEENIPSKEVAQICLDIFHEKYISKMNKQEIMLAFEMNIKGELEQMIGGVLKRKVEHFQCFSVEYFCEVLNWYLEIKRGAIIKRNNNTKQEILSLEAPSALSDMLTDMVNDFRFYFNQLPERGVVQFSLSTKIELMAQMFTINVSEENIAKLRSKARDAVLRNLYSQKQEARKLQKFGAEMSLIHQITRLKNNKLLTQMDEKLIQTEVNVLLYHQTFARYEGDFIEHINFNITKNK